MKYFNWIAPSGPRGTVGSCRSSRVTAFDTSKHVWSLDRCVSMSLHLRSWTRIETWANITVGVCLGLALAMGFTEVVSSSSLVSIDSVTNLSTPFTILTQDADWSSNKDGTRTSILYRSSRLQTFMLKTAQISCSCKSILSYVSLFRPDPLCTLSAQMLHLFSFFWVKSFGVLSFFDQLQTRFGT